MQYQEWLKQNVLNIVKEKCPKEPRIPFKLIAESCTDVPDFKIYSSPPDFHDFLQEVYKSNPYGLISFFFEEGYYNTSKEYKVEEISEQFPVDRLCIFSKPQSNFFHIYLPTTPNPEEFNRDYYRWLISGFLDSAVDSEILEVTRLKSKTPGEQTYAVKILDSNYSVPLFIMQLLVKETLEDGRIVVSW